MSKIQRDGTFQNEQEYCDAILSVTKERVDLYCRTCVSLDENGALARIRGRLLFKEELDRLLEPAFSDQEIRDYRMRMEEIREKEREIQQKGQTYMAGGGMLALEYLCRIFGLTELDRYLIVMSYAAEMDAQFERVYCLLQDDYSLKLPTLDLCIRILTLDPKERLLLQQQVTERFPLLGYFFDGLDEVTEEVGADGRSVLLSMPLKLNGRIVMFLRDVTSIDESLRRYTERIMPGDWPEDMVIRKAYTKTLRNLVEGTKGERFLYICGSKDIGKKTLVRQFGRETGRPLLLVHTPRLAKSDHIGKEVRKLIRESYLCGHAWICFADVESPEEPEEADTLLEELMWSLRDYTGVPLFTSRSAWNGAADTMGRQCVEFRLPDTDAGEREVLWKAFLSRDEWPKDLDPERLARKYTLSPGAIRKSVEEARQQRILEGTLSITKNMLFAACQKQLVHKLGQDAVRINSPYQWEDLILPAPQKRLLRDACDQVEYENQVYREWGFRQKVAYGRGVSMIFYGPPGTGKTMGAQVMANELGLELYKVNMASVMSRYVGDSEKKLDYIFEQGKRSQSILFFDEADVLFGKRSETKDAQDKYANASTAYLLQKVEEYEGILVLATNFLQNFDNAFRRRFKFIIEFPFPDQENRRSIWEHVFPEKMKFEEPIDVDWLAEEYKFSGSQIKNIVLAASFLAAGEQSGLTMRHILTALKREQAKEGKQMIASDFGKYYYLMEERQG